ncbi:MAG: hypothetical protein H3C28_14970 [Sphingomonadales bacterium]|nr:hypothetical protein [Sphingomonadales bacterium]
MTTIDRRQALIGLSIVSALASAGVAAEIGEAMDPALPPAAYLKHAVSAHILGQAYLQQAPEEADAQALNRLVGGDSVTRETLRARIARDLEAGDLVNVAGCFMARTEARLCALAALS